jgi:hypothetical protein
MLMILLDIVSQRRVRHATPPPPSATRPSHIYIQTQKEEQEVKEKYHDHNEILTRGFEVFFV